MNLKKYENSMGWLRNLFRGDRFIWRNCKMNVNKNPGNEKGETAESKITSFPYRDIFKESDPVPTASSITLKPVDESPQAEKCQEEPDIFEREQKMVLAIMQTGNARLIQKVQAGQIAIEEAYRQIQVLQPSQSQSPSTNAAGEKAQPSLTLKIDREIQNCISDISSEAQSLLETLILEKKITPVITTWNDSVLDGHHVKEICDRHGITYQRNSYPALTKTQAIIYRIRLHLARRNMTLPQRLAASCTLEKFLLEEARGNLRLGPGKKALGHVTQGFEPRHTNQRIAQEAGTSEKTAQRFRFVRHSGCQDIIDQMMTGELPIGKAYRKAKEFQRKKESPIFPFKNPESGTWDNTLWNEDNLVTLDRMAQEIPHSVDLFVFDPPWNVGKDYGFGEEADRLPHDQFIDNLLRRFPLMATCAKVGGKLCCIIEQTRTPKDERDSGEDYVRPIDLDLINGVRKLHCGLRLMERIIFIKPAGAASMAWGSYNSSSCPILRPHWGMVIVWAYQDFKLNNPYNIEPDYTKAEHDEWTINPWFISRKGMVNTKNHPGTTPPDIIERLIRLYTSRGSLICDPYNGTGTTTQLCQHFNRRYIGIEKNAAYCQLAQKSAHVA
jgi:site-specific DNA-methyltransferase (adenine-specific)